MYCGHQERGKRAYSFIDQWQNAFIELSAKTGLFHFDALMPYSICYDASMRTTLTIDDKLAAALKKRAFETGKSFKEVVNEVLRAGLMADQASPPKAKPFKIKPMSLGGPQPGINLDKANQLAGELDDEELIRKMRLRK
jgi:hypothetical protein